MERDFRGTRSPSHLPTEMALATGTEQAPKETGRCGCKLVSLTTSSFTAMLPVNGAVREGEVGQDIFGGALLEVRDRLPLANFRQHGNHCGKSYPSQCLCIFMSPHMYALLKSGI